MTSTIEKFSKFWKSIWRNDVTPSLERHFVYLVSIALLYRVLGRMLWAVHSMRQLIVIEVCQVCWWNLCSKIEQSNWDILSIFSIQYYSIKYLSITLICSYHETTDCYEGMSSILQVSVYSTGKLNRDILSVLSMQCYGVNYSSGTLIYWVHETCDCYLGMLSMIREVAQQSNGDLLCVSQYCRLMLNTFIFQIPLSYQTNVSRHMASISMSKIELLFLFCCERI